ncbi:MAG: hypothetical protein WCV79_02160 [Candidatus Paceibacterota bacterium]
MTRDYGLTSPSLNGILSHDSITYGGLKRPIIVNRIFDMPSGGSSIDLKQAENKRVIEEYFGDLYGVLMKKLSHFYLESNPTEEDSVRLTAMLHELIKVKKLLQKRV